MKDRERHPGGIVHTYQRYDPQRFPPPTAPGGGSDLADAAMNHMMMFGTRRRLTEEELRDAVRIDPSQIAGLGPSLDAMIAMLEERRRRILETYDPTGAQLGAHDAYSQIAGATAGMSPDELLENALRRGHVAQLERLWYIAERTNPALAAQLMQAIARLGERYEIDELNAKWAFTGREPVDVPRALELKEVLDTIERLLEQLREALKDAKVGIIDLDELKNFVDEAGVEQLEEMGRQIEELIRRQAEAQGLERGEDGAYRLTPKAHRVFQAKLLDEIFSELDAARSGRHEGPIVGEGVVELPTTRGYEFGDAASHIDLPQTITNAAIRSRGSGQRFGVKPEDIDVHLTKNNPKCATCLLIDMSGSMGQMGQYVQSKRMALAMDGLIRSEYPGDFLRAIEIATFAKPVAPGEIINLMPKPVTIREPVVRLRVDTADPRISESMVHPHFTNIQHGLSLARRMLANVDTPNKQVMLFTDGLPTAHFENGPDTGVEGGESNYLYMLYPPDPLTERATMREAMACRREGITINVFLLPSWGQDEDDIAFAQRLAERTCGRVLFAGGEDLDRFVLWDYVTMRRKIIG